MSGRISYLGGIVKNGLILDLDAAKQDSYPRLGTLWKDISGNGNNGTLTNGPTFNSGNGGNIVFDGVDDYIRTSFIPTIGVNDITYESWFKTGTAQTGAIINVRSASAVQFVLVLSNPSGGYGSNLLVYSYDGSLDRGAASTESWVDNNWHHAVAVHKSEIDVLYVDGILRASVTTSPLNINNSTILRIGALGNGVSEYPGWFFNGTISGAKIYNKALSVSEVLQNYNATKGRYL